MKYCKLFYCDKRKEKICCTTCQSRGRCRNRCLNDPSRCRSEDTKRSGRDARESEG